MITIFICIFFYVVMNDWTSVVVILFIFIGVCSIIQGLPVHWLWDQLYPSGLCQEQSSLEATATQPGYLRQQRLLEGTRLLTVG